MLSAVSSCCSSPAVMCQRHQCVKGVNVCESVFPESLPVCMRVSEVVQMGRHGFSFQANQRLFDVLMFNIVNDAVMSDPCHYHQHQLSMQESDICILPLLMVKHNSISAC